MDQELLVGKLTVLSISSADRRGDRDTVLLPTRDDAVWRSIITLTRCMPGELQHGGR